MKEFSDDELSKLLQRWDAPELPGDLTPGVWARVVDARAPRIRWLRSAWAFRLAIAATALLWVAALRLPVHTASAQATDSLTQALAMAGDSR